MSFKNSKNEKWIRKTAAVSMVVTLNLTSFGNLCVDSFAEEFHTESDMEFEDAFIEDEQYALGDKALLDDIVTTEEGDILNETDSDIEEYDEEFAQDFSDENDFDFFGDPTEIQSELLEAEDTENSSISKVSGKQIAADGVYSSSIIATKNKKGKTKTYYATLFLSVENGVISDIWISARDKQDRFNTIAAQARMNYVGKPAAKGIGTQADTYTSASMSGSSSGSSEYSVNLTDAIENALASAPTAETQPDGPNTNKNFAKEGIYQGTASMSNGHYITLKVTVNDQAKISDLVIVDADGNWDNLFGTVKNDYIDMDADISESDNAIDTVTTATSNGYRQAIADAIKNALRSEVNTENTGEEPTKDDSTKEEPEKDETICYIKGTRQTITGVTYKGSVLVENDAIITFENCWFPYGIELEDAEATAIVNNCYFGTEKFYIPIKSNVLGELEEESEVTKNTGLAAAFPETVENADNTGSITQAKYKESRLVTIPEWAEGKEYNFENSGRSYRGYYLTGTLPKVETNQYQSFNTYISYVDHSGYAAGETQLNVMIPIVFTVSPKEKKPSVQKCEHVTEIIPGKAATVSETGLTDGKRCSVCGEILEEQKEIPKLTSLAKPGLVNATIVGGGVQVKWNPVEGAETYRVFRKLSSEKSWTKLADTDDNTYVDTKAVSGKTYVYTVRCLNETKKGYASGYDTKGKSVLYLAKGVVSKIVNLSTGGLQITWKAVAGAKGYVIYRKMNEETSWTAVATIKNGKTVTYKDAKATSNGAKYTYAVRPYSDSFKGAYASKTYYRLGTHKIASVINNAAGKITIKWNRNSHATGYQVRYKNGSTDKTVTIKSNETLSTVIKSLKKGQTYNVYVRGYLNADGENYYSAWSEVKNVKITK